MVSSSLILVIICIGDNPKLFYMILKGSVYVLLKKLYEDDATNKDNNKSEDLTISTVNLDFILNPITNRNTPKNSQLNTPKTEKNGKISRKNVEFKPSSSASNRLHHMTIQTCFGTSRNSFHIFGNNGKRKTSRIVSPTNTKEFFFNSKLGNSPKSKDIETRNIRGSQPKNDEIKMGAENFPEINPGYYVSKTLASGDHFGEIALSNNVIRYYEYLIYFIQL